MAMLYTSPLDPSWITRWNSGAVIPVRRFKYFIRETSRTVHEDEVVNGPIVGRDDANQTWTIRKSDREICEA